MIQAFRQMVHSVQARESAVQHAADARQSSSGKADP